MQELGIQHYIQDLLRKIENAEDILYSINGNRASHPGDILKKLEPLLPTLGITRIAEISQLSFGNFPVFQSSRPNLFFHAKIGQNSGAQGKGITIEQAKISCMMESVEAYCAEPKNIKLIRASYEFLTHHHVIFDPEKYLHRDGVSALGMDEPLMWTEACSLEQRSTLLVPAETVFMPFLANDYKTRSIFPCSSNGLAAGSTYLEAITHGLYEVIERHYRGLFEMGAIDAEVLFEDEVTCIDLNELKAALGSKYQLQLFALTLPLIKNLPMVVCALVREDGSANLGYGCSGNLDMSLHRAISEALQSLATRNSGSREDMEFRGQVRHNFPTIRTLRLNAYRQKIVDAVFRDLLTEYRSLMRWVHKAGFANVFAANLTRRGIDIPVVKIIVPGMLTVAASREAFEGTSEMVRSISYQFQ